MNPRTTTVLALSLLAVIPALAAQNVVPNPKTGAATIEPPQEVKKPPARARQSASPDADARTCLQFPNNLQVMACAEKYRPQRRNA